MAFDAGAIEATLELDRDPFQRGLEEARAEAEAFEANKITAQMEFDAGAAATEMAAIRAEAEALDGMRINMTVDVDAAGATTQLAGVRAAASDTDQNLNLLSRSGNAAGGMFSMLNVRVVLIATAIATLLAPALGLAASLITSIGPAAAIGLGAFASIKLGMDGIKAAAKTLQPDIDKLKKALSEQWREGLTPMFKELRTLMPVVQTGLRQVTTGLLDMARGFVAVMTSAQTMKDLQVTFTSVGNFLTSLRPMVENFSQAFVTMARIGSENLGSLSQALQNFALGFNKVIQDASKTGVLATAFQQLGGTVQALGGLFNQLMASGLQMMATLGPSLNAFINNFTTMFAGLGPVLTTVSQLLLGVFGEAFKQLGPVFQSIQPAIQQLATALGGVLVTGIQQLAPLLGPLVSGVAQLATAVTPLLPPLIQLGTSVLGAIISAVTPLIPSITQLGQVLGAGLTGIVGALTPILTTLASIIGSVLAPVITALTPVVQSVIQVLTAVISVLTPLMPLFSAVANVVGAILTPVLTILGALIQNVIVPVIGFFADKLQWVAEKLALLTGPIQAVGGWLTDLGAKFGLTSKSAETDMTKTSAAVQTNMDKAQGSVNTGGAAILQGADTAFKGTADSAQTNLGAVPVTATTEFAKVPATATAEFAKVPAAIKTSMDQAVAQIKTSGTLMATTLKTSAWDKMNTDAKAALVVLNTTVKTGMDVVVKTIAAAAVLMVAALPTAEQMAQAGAALMDGLIQGIQSRMQALQATMQQVSGLIRGAIPASPAKWGPLSGRGAPNYGGQAIVNMLAQGLSQTSPIEQQMATIAQMMSPNANATVGLATQAQYATLGAGPQGAAGGQRSMVENLNVNVKSNASAKEIVAETLFALSHAGKGVYG